MTKRFNKVRGRMAELGIKQYQLAKDLGMTNGQLSRRLNEQTDFTLDEVIAICKLLNITDPTPYFFTL